MRTGLKFDAAQGLIRLKAEEDARQQALSNAMADVKRLDFTTLKAYAAKYLADF